MCDNPFLERAGSEYPCKFLDFGKCAVPNSKQSVASGCTLLPPAEIETIVLYKRLYFLLSRRGDKTAVFDDFLHRKNGSTEEDDRFMAWATGPVPQSLLQAYEAEQGCTAVEVPVGSQIKFAHQEWSFDELLDVLGSHERQQRRLEAMARGVQPAAKKRKVKKPVANRNVEMESAVDMRREEQPRAMAMEVEQEQESLQEAVVKRPEERSAEVIGNHDDSHQC
jgi:hypothetical protein